jgi:ATP-dependent RNA helicase DeaD
MKPSSSEPSSHTTAPSFHDLGLSTALLTALKEVGYETASPIQAATIPVMLAGRDVLGQAQTGTGKTAAFALPILAQIDPKPSTPQALVLVPTRELAIQVAEAFQRYASHIPGFHVLPVYGGQAYGNQLAALRRGVHVVVGTPGRIIDHLERRTLDLSSVRTLVLDEADEMLRMGFIEEVERILRDTPSTRQTALFSATMPAAVKRIAQQHMRQATEVTVAARTTTAAGIRQRYWLVSGMHKLDALVRILEGEPFEAMIVFSRTKLGADEITMKLVARGFSAAAIHGDMQQSQRERTVGQLKAGSIDILVATDVAARGLDVERISHVLNYDVPSDPESYTHRIGRTGRAGRSGEAILFVTPRERGLLKAIERATRQPIALMQLPTLREVNDARIARFKGRIAETLAEGGLESMAAVIADYERETNVPVIEIAAALARMARDGEPLVIEKPVRDRGPRTDAFEAPNGEASDNNAGRSTDVSETHELATSPPSPAARRTHPGSQTQAEPVRGNPVRMDTARGSGVNYRVEVGSSHGVKPGNLVGAIANEAGLQAHLIGRIDIQSEYSLVELPPGLPARVLKHLQTVRVGGRPLRIRPEEAAVKPPWQTKPARVHAPSAPGEAPVKRYRVKSKGPVKT